MHLHAREAAVAAEAAGLQGKFWEMHDLLYQEQAAWSVAKDIHLLFNGYAKTLGLDEQRFASDMAGPKVNDLVSSDEKRGASLGVKNTPTIFLNNKAVDPKTYNPTELQTAIETALGEKEKSQHST
jgi:protein-disulfide isomerase